MYHRFNVLDNRDGSIIALNEYATSPEEAIKQVAKRTNHKVEHLRAEKTSTGIEGF